MNTTSDSFVGGSLEPEIAVEQGSDCEEEVGVCCLQISTCITSVQTQIARMNSWLFFLFLPSDMIVEPNM